MLNLYYNIFFILFYGTYTWYKKTITAEDSTSSTNLIPNADASTKHTEPNQNNLESTSTEDFTKTSNSTETDQPTTLLDPANAVFDLDMIDTDTPDFTTE